MDSQPPPGTLRVMTFNIWCDHPRHPVWGKRLPVAVGLLRYHRPTLVGGQEFCLNQLRDLTRELSAYRCLGVGRDDGREGGEFVPIFYRADRLEPLAHGTFWLAENPAVPGKGWDAAYPRIVTWARFLDQRTGRRFVHFNTHFDHLGRRARRESAQLLLRRLEATAPGEPAIVTGDLNSLERSATYAILTGQVPGEQSARFSLRDTLRCTHFPPLGPRKSWSGFLPGKLAAARLDYIFVGAGIKVWQHATLTDHGPDGRYPSDHRPVVAELEIGGETADAAARG